MTQTFTGILVIEHCCNCGIAFGLERSFRDKMLELGPAGEFHCPRGHVQHFRYAKGNNLEDQLKREQQRNKSLGAIIDRQRETIKGRDHIIRGQKAAKTKLKNRIANGVCPCCNRSFHNLQQHMSKQHPDFKSVQE